MSWTTFLLFSCISFASMFACYRIGQQSIIERYKDYARKRRERELRWAEFDDED